MMLILRSMMKMKQSQFKEILKSLEEVLSGLPSTIPVADKDLMEQQILNKKLQIEYDSASHGGTQKLYEHFLEHKDLKWIWCHSGNRYGVDPKELYERAPDRCPVFGTLLDYGLGKNTATNHPAFRPSMDHVEQQSRGGVKREDITNFEVMSVQANTYRNNATTMHQLYLLKYELTKI
jgi:hypothetical protein